MNCGHKQRKADQITHTGDDRKNIHLTYVQDRSRSMQTIQALMLLARPPPPSPQPQLLTVVLAQLLLPMKHFLTPKKSLTLPIHTEEHIQDRSLLAIFIIHGLVIMMNWSGEQLGLQRPRDQRLISPVPKTYTTNSKAPRTSHFRGIIRNLAHKFSCTILLVNLATD